jgi:transglutaminase-like putative cysteine protease
MEQKSQKLDWYNAFLLVLMIYTAAARLTASNWIKYLSVVETMAVMGTVLGLAIGISKFQARGIRWLITGYTALIIPLQLTRLVEGEDLLSDRLLSLGGRVAASFSLLFKGKDILDPVFFILLMSLLFWGIGIFSGFRLTRHSSFIAAVIPSVIPLLIVQYYDGGNLRRLWLVAFYFFLLLLLLGRTSLQQNRQRWSRERVFTGIEPSFDLNYAILVGALALILISWSLPVTISALPSAVRWWKDATSPLEETRQRLDDMFASLRQSVVNTGRFSTVMGLGREASKGDQAIFYVNPPDVALPRLYWRMVVYDRYIDGAWRSTGVNRRGFSPDSDPLPLAFLQGQPTEDFTFNWQGQPETFLALPIGTVWTSRNGSWQVSRAGEDAFEFISQNVSAPIRPGDRYTARAVVTNPSVTEMRAAGQDYPKWVTDRYLQLPDTLSPQFRGLATRLADGQKTPYDVAQNVTDYLRTEITYSESIPAPTPGTDLMDWFLFSWKSGFCNYYATAEVLLLRSAGIPARMAVGYAQGAPSNGEFMVRGRDIHAWPEVFFPGIGWVQFEPTTSQLALVRPFNNVTQGPGDEFEGTNRELSLPVSDDDLNLTPQPGLNDNASVANTSIPYALIGRWIIIISFSGAFVYWLWRLNRQFPIIFRLPRAIRDAYLRNQRTPPAWVERWALWSELSPVERAFHAVNQCLAWLQKPQAASVTAKERASLLSELIPDAAGEIQALAVEHEKTLFSPHPGDPARARQASWKIRYFTIRQIVRSRFFGALS